MEKRNNRRRLTLIWALGAVTVVCLYMVARAPGVGNIGAFVASMLVLFVSCPLLVVLAMRHARSRESSRWIRNLFVRDEHDAPRTSFIPRWFVVLMIYVMSTVLIFSFLFIIFQISKYAWFS